LVPVWVLAEDMSHLMEPINVTSMVMMKLETLPELLISRELVNTTLVKTLHKTLIQLGSKYYNHNSLTFIISYRFGSSIRKDAKRMLAPGPGAHEYKNHTDSGTKHQL
jgi:hypothetical protein